MTDTLRRTITVTMDANLWRTLQKTGNRSAYLSKIAEQRWREWQAAIAYLRDHKWSAAEIKAAIEALWGLRLDWCPKAVEIINALNSPAVALSVKRRSHISQWGRLVGAIDENAAWALWTLVQEERAGNAECRHQIATLSR